MVKIIVAFSTQAKCDQYAAALEESGYPVFRSCTSASEVKRTLNQCGDGIVITSCRLPDSTIDALADDLEKLTQALQGLSADLRRSAEESRKEDDR